MCVKLTSIEANSITSLPNPMFDLFLESSLWDDSDKGSNVGFGQEICILEMKIRTLSVALQYISPQQQVCSCDCCDQWPVNLSAFCFRSLMRFLYYLSQQVTLSSLQTKLFFPYFVSFKKVSKQFYADIKYNLSVKQFGSQMRPNILLDILYIQFLQRSSTVIKGYQQFSTANWQRAIPRQIS